LRAGDITAHRDGLGELLADLSQAVVRLYEECYGKRPDSATAHVSGDIVVCLLEGAPPRGQRRAGVRRRFVEAIEELTGREVKSYISGVDVQTGTNAEVFVLAPEAEIGDELEAIHTWAVQMRRSRAAP
jgi:uncharacterized protein YbcI